MDQIVGGKWVAGNRQRGEGEAILKIWTHLLEFIELKSYHNQYKVFQATHIIEYQNAS